MTASSWTDERIQTLTTLWLGGYSAAQVAAALGGVTRNAVIGKLHRLGIAGRIAAAPPRIATPGSGSRAIHEARRPRPPARARPSASRPARSAHALPEASPLVADLTLLARDHCRWPIGDPAAESFGFCGRPAFAGGPYCERHYGRAYRGSASPRDADLHARRRLGVPA